MVIGVGGLGHLAVQILRALTAARVIALDVSEDKLALARTVDAHETVLSDEQATEKVRDLTGGHGAQAIFDFVGAQPTVDTAGAVAALEADITLVGIGGGTLATGFGHLPFDAAVRAPYWGTRPEFHEVLELARAGALSVHTETYSLDEARRAYERLHDGHIQGRAVIGRRLTSARLWLMAVETRQRPTPHHPGAHPTDPPALAQPPR
ncbi:zinc-binding dehydrogenase [Saccharopolyspora sp. NPDC049357]|uniref:zinc-binding dehydrogenase n=1 Tax=Saccharopolyspora sp. NPDC049357 TaxID=3154507 RepID=UPI003412F49E